MSTTKKIEAGQYEVTSDAGEVFHVIKTIHPYWSVYKGGEFQGSYTFKKKSAAIEAIDSGTFTELPTFPSAEELLALPVTCQGQVHDLHLENHFTPAFSGVRFWVSRCGIEDGEPFEVTVYIEVREWIPGEPSWYDLGHYNGSEPVESLAGYSPSDLGCGRGLLDF